jgi:hypothetical protein
VIFLGAGLLNLKKTYEVKTHTHTKTRIQL